MSIRNINRVSMLLQPVNIPDRNTPVQQDIPKSYRHMVRYGIIRMVTPGMYAFLPLGLRVLEKLIVLVENEMTKIGAQKLMLPALTDVELWQKTGRYNNARTELFVTKDRNNRQYLLSPTYEEGICNLISTIPNITSKMLPLKLYQISSKWRDEMKPRLGFLRSKEFVMKDLYTFDRNSEDALKTYNLLCDTYDNIFRKIGIEYIKATGDPGAIGGQMSHEYHYLSEIGEDTVLTCSSCHYYVNKNISNEKNCPHCKNTLSEHTAMELGHTFLLGTKYSKPFNAVCIGSKVPLPLVMGCYGLGLSRIITMAVEKLSLDNEIRWPKHLAPYTVCVLPPKAGSKQEKATQYVDQITEILSRLNIDTIIDDRTNLTIGNRFVYARITGYPYVIIIGKSSIQERPLFEIHDINNAKQYELPLESISDYFKDSYLKDCEMN